MGQEVDADGDAEFVRMLLIPMGPSRQDDQASDSFASPRWGTDEAVDWPQRLVGAKVSMAGTEKPFCRTLGPMYLGT